MKKKLLSTLLALCMALSLCPAAFAADDGAPSDEEIWSYIHLSIVEDDDLDYYVENPVTLYDAVLGYEAVDSLSGFNYLEHGAKLKVENGAPKGSTCAMGVTLQVYILRDGDYVTAGPMDHYYLAKNSFVPGALSDEEFGGIVDLAPGESFTFSLPEDLDSDDTLFVLQATLYYYEYEQNWWMTYGFIFDDEAVARIREEQAGSEAPQPGDADELNFTDVPNWCSAAVDWAVEKGISNGTGNTTFSPDIECTQAQILTMLYRAAGKPDVKGELPFTVADAYRNAILWAADEDMIELDGFDPEAPCTRSSTMNFIWQAFDSPDPDGDASGFEDVDTEACYADAVAWAVENGITNGNGSDTIFSPDETCTRGQIVTFLHRAYVPEVRVK